MHCVGRRRATDMEIECRSKRSRETYGRSRDNGRQWTTLEGTVGRTVGGGHFGLSGRFRPATRRMLSATPRELWCSALTRLLCASTATIWRLGFAGANSSTSTRTRVRRLGGA